MITEAQTLIALSAPGGVLRPPPAIAAIVAAKWLDYTVLPDIAAAHNALEEGDSIGLMVDASEAAALVAEVAADRAKVQPGFVTAAMRIARQNGDTELVTVGFVSGNGPTARYYPRFKQSKAPPDAKPVVDLQALLMVCALTRLDVVGRKMVTA